MPLDPGCFAAKTITVFGKTLEIVVFTEPISPEFARIRVNEIWGSERPAITVDSYFAKQALVPLIAALQAVADLMIAEE